MQRCCLSYVFATLSEVGRTCGFIFARANRTHRTSYCLSEISTFSILHICVASMSFFIFSLRAENVTTRRIISVHQTRYSSILLMFSRRSGFMFLFLPTIYVRPRTVVNLLWLERGMAWLSRFLLLLVALTTASLFNYIDLTSTTFVLFYPIFCITLWFIVQLNVNKVISAQFIFLFF